MLKKRNVVAGLLLAAALLIISTGCANASEKTAAEQADAKELRNNPKLGFAPLPIKFGEAIGLVTHLARGEEPLERLNDLKNLGIKWVRDEQGWDNVERKKGEYTWPEKRKKCAKFFKENGISIIYPVTYGANKNVYPDDPYNPEGFGRYAVASAKFYKEAGVEVVMEIFNEPHNFGLTKKYGGSVYGEPNCPWIDHYVKMANEAIKQVKAYDPTIKLMANEDVWSCHYWYLEGNMDKRIDGFAIHPYTFHGHTPGPEVSPYPQKLAGWTIMDEDNSSRSLMRRLRAQYAEKIGRPLEMYITEWGYPVGGKGYEKGIRVTEDDVAGYLPRAYMSGVAAGAKVVCWHVSQDSGDGPFGLFRNDQTKRKTYYSLKALVEQLGDYQMVKQFAGLDNTTTGIQAYLFEGDAGYKLAIWNIEGPVEVAFDSAYNSPLRVYDHFGKALPIRFAKDGPPILTLDRAPIYIEGIGESCSLEPLSLNQTK